MTRSAQVVAERRGGEDTHSPSLVAAVRTPCPLARGVLAGWAVHLDFLADALEGRPVDWRNWPIDRWEAHHRRYLERLR